MLLCLAGLTPRKIAEKIPNINQERHSSPALNLFEGLQA